MLRARPFEMHMVTAKVRENLRRRRPTSTIKSNLKLQSSKTIVPRESHTLCEAVISVGEGIKRCRQRKVRVERWMKALRGAANGGKARLVHMTGRRLRLLSTVSVGKRESESQINVGEQRRGSSE